MGKGNKLEFKQKLEYKEAVSYLEALLESFKSGTIVVSKGDEVINLTPSSEVEIEIEARNKKDKGKFSMEISWKGPEECDQPLTIEPAVNTTEEAAETDAE